MEELQIARYREEGCCKAFMPSLGTPPFPHLSMFTSESSLPRVLMCQSVFIPSLFLRSWDGGAESAHPLIMCLVFLVASPHLGAPP